VKSKGEVKRMYSSASIEMRELSFCGVTIGKLQEAIQLCANGGGLCDATMPPNESARILGAGLPTG
jgi:hypothetical protein